jgi:hypothetical protein
MGDHLKAALYFEECAEQEPRPTERGRLLRPPDNFAGWQLRKPVGLRIGRRPRGNATRRGDARGPHPAPTDSELKRDGCCSSCSDGLDLTGP